ncbi:MAG TPA: cytochrome P450, partial [Solirubrobacteraceae bacterium]|nr:cytochrome P450 [Solirubrobacteraceae bacterium]
EIILRAVFGLDPGPRMEALRERLATMLQFGERPISLLPPRPGSLMEKVAEQVGPFAQFVRIQAEADRLIAELIAERRNDPAERHDVLAMLLAARRQDGSGLRADELRDELMTLLVAGHETTASTLAWCFDHVGRQAGLVDRLRQEGDAYVTATVQEALRHRPVLPNVAPRLVVRPIEVGGVAYPEGVCLVPNAYLVHHDADIYPDPYAFRPERFLDENPGTYTWIPFGGGRRRCLGATFAMLEMKIVVQALVRARDVRPVAPGFEPARRRNITVRPADGCLVRLPLRARSAPAMAPPSDRNAGRPLGALAG